MPHRPVGGPPTPARTPEGSPRRAPTRPARRWTGRRESRRSALVRWAGLVAGILTVALTVSACASAGDDVVTVTSTAGPAVTAPGLDASTAPTTATSEGLASKVRFSSKPKFGTTDLEPTTPVTVTVFSAKLEELRVTADDGLDVAGEIAEDKATWKLTERLRYNTTYTFSGTAIGADGERSEITGTLATLNPAKLVRASFQIPSGTTVGIAAPIMITFTEPVQDKAAAQSTFKVTTDKGDIEGSWGWLQDEDFAGLGYLQSRVHFRPKAYWPGNTNVHVEANLYGVDYGNDAWGEEDIVTDFTIGRAMKVIADVTSFRMVVLVDDKVVRNYAVSYGKESVPGRATVSGTHVVTEKFEEFEMCNPTFDYCNLKEKWAVRINNNGEFIHENPLTIPYLGKQNVSHGCVNMGPGDAKEFYDMVIYGDPVEVSNTGAPMTEKDYIYDWIYSWDKWQELSAL